MFTVVINPSTYHIFVSGMAWSSPFAPVQRKCEFIWSGDAGETLKKYISVSLHFAYNIL